MDYVCNAEGVNKPSLIKQEPSSFNDVALAQKPMPTQDPRKQLLEILNQRQQANEEFLHSSQKDVVDEVVELVNDGIDYVGLIDKDRAAYSAMTFFFIHILLPQSNGLYVTLLSGNLPLCFATLRLLVETLAKCYYADATHPDLFFGEKLSLFEKELRENRISTARIVRKAGEMAGIKNGLSDLWLTLSNEWVHPMGIASGMINQLDATDDFPGWGIILPVEYKPTDSRTLEQFTAKVADFRKAMKPVVEDWKRRFAK